jgi:predicted RNase H-like HicB family nuclease
MVAQVVEQVAAFRVVIDRLGLADGGGYVATVPELPGVMAEGKTRAQAARNVGNAIAAWIEEAEALGWPVPSPSWSPGVAEG